MFYFGYGSNLLESRIRQADRAPGARRIGTGVLAGHALRFHKRGQDGSAKCDCHRLEESDHSVGAKPEEQIRRVVYGVLFEISRHEKVALDRVEGLGSGYQAKEVEVSTSDGSTTAWLYLAEASYIDPSLLPFDWYRDLVLHGSIEAGFPADYVAAIAQTPVRPDDDSKRSRLMRRLLPAPF